MTSRKNDNSNFFGQRIRHLRKKKKILLRQMATELQVDTALVSKFETGERKAQKQQLPIIAKFLQTEENDLTILWLADKIQEAVAQELLADKAIAFITKERKKENAV